MFSHESRIDYPLLNNSLPFADYIAQCRELISTRRTDLIATNAQKIIDSNCPHEYRPEKAKQPFGALLLHGLLDCPFSFHDIGNHLKKHDVLSRSILLPGHGTHPSDLLKVRYEDWIHAMRYGVNSLSKEVEKIFLVGYSTGAALSIYQALADERIAGIILLSPAVRIGAPLHYLIRMQRFIKMISRRYPWAYQLAENDYTKYHAAPWNAVSQVFLLTQLIKRLTKNKQLLSPIFMAISDVDETICSQSAINFFANQHHPASKLYLYSSKTSHQIKDKHRLIVKDTNYPSLHINNFSHTSLPFEPNNYHYGQQGDYLFASHLNDEGVAFGAYDKVENAISDTLYQAKLAPQKHRELTYNPDFEGMMNQITAFMNGQMRR